jgi:SnoaL-like domain
MTAPSEVQELIGRWWFTYDQGLFEELDSLLTEDMHFTVRTDTGKTDYEEFVNADIRGKSDVMIWQADHRLDSPSPLRHNGTNVHLTGARGSDDLFTSYIFVTQIVEGQVSNLSTGIVTGSVRKEAGGLKLSSLHVVLDTESSRPLREVRAAESQVGG